MNQSNSSTSPGVPAPSGKAYHVDWVISNTSDVHVANHRDWFTSYTPFKTYCGQIYSDDRADVAGIGTVQLKVRLHKQNRPGRTNFRIITLHNVLHVPGYCCNVIAANPSSEYRFDGTAKLLDKDGNLAGLVESVVLLRLRLHGQAPGESSLEADGIYMINARWPVGERARWLAHLAAELGIPLVIQKEDETYSEDERAWLKENYGGEFKFLRAHGLSIHKDEDREEGMAIVRAFMRNNDDKSEGVGPEVSDFVRDDDEDEDEEEEDDGDKFLRELEEDPMSHLADYHFSDKELSWIEEHYQYSANFMRSYGLKPFDDGDCAEAKGIIKDMMEED